MAEVVNEAFRIMEIMEEKDLYPTEHFDCAKNVISSYPKSKIKVSTHKGKNERIPYEIVGASIWLTGIAMGGQYYRSLHSIIYRVIREELDVSIVRDAVRDTGKEMAKDPKVKKILIEIHKSYGRQKIPKKFKILEYLKGS